MVPSSHCPASLPPRAIRRGLIAVALGAAVCISIIYYGSLLAHRNTPLGGMTRSHAWGVQQAHAAAANAVIAGQQTSARATAFPEPAANPVDTSNSSAPRADGLHDQLLRIQTDYRELSEQIYERSAPLIEPADRAALTLLQNEKRSDLAQVLTPGEVELFEAKFNETPAPKRR